MNSRVQFFTGIEDAAVGRTLIFFTAITTVYGRHGRHGGRHGRRGYTVACACNTEITPESYAVVVLLDPPWGLFTHACIPHGTPPRPVRRHAVDECCFLLPERFAGTTWRSRTTSRAWIGTVSDWSPSSRRDDNPPAPAPAPPPPATTVPGGGVVPSCSDGGVQSMTGDERVSLRTDW